MYTDPLSIRPSRNGNYHYILTVTQGRQHLTQIIAESEERKGIPQLKEIAQRFAPRWENPTIKWAGRTLL